MNRALLASAALLLLLPVADVVAKSSDRNQAMTIDSGSQSGNMEGNGKTVLGGGVVVTQGTLEIRSAAAEIYMADGEVSRSVFTGKQVKMKQQMERPKRTPGNGSRGESSSGTSEKIFCPVLILAEDIFPRADSRRKNIGGGLDGHELRELLRRNTLFTR